MRIIGATSRNSKLIPQLLRIIWSDALCREGSRDAKPPDDRPLAGSQRDTLVQPGVRATLIETADVIRVVLRRHRRDFPKFRCGKVSG